MILDVSVKKRMGAFQLDATFRTDSSVTAIFGRSGSGKTSLLRQIAGLTHPDAGHIAVDNQTIVDTSRQVRLPAHRRHFGFVFQDARLFPHLTVKQNLNYGRFFAGRREKALDEKRVVDILGIGSLLNRKPHHLSGGEKQRVAIGRALLSSPRLLLLDEPLASLDETRKQEILALLEQMRDELRISMIYVSHSVQEVARLASDVVVMKDGKVEIVGAASDIINQPSFYEAAARNEAGSIIEATVKGYELAHGLSVLNLPGGTLFVPGAELAVGQKVRVHIPARDVMISTQMPEGLSALNVLSGTMAEISPGNGNAVTVVVNCAGSMVAARLTSLSVQRLNLVKGMPVFAIIKTVALDQRN